MHYIIIIQCIVQLYVFYRLVLVFHLEVLMLYFILFLFIISSKPRRDEEQLSQKEIELKQKDAEVRYSSFTQIFIQSRVPASPSCFD